MEELIAWAIFSGLVIHALVGENGMVNHFFPGWSKAIGTDKPDMGDTICTVSYTHLTLPTILRV